MSHSATEFLKQEHDLILTFLEIMGTLRRRFEQGQFASLAQLQTALTFIGDIADRGHHAKEEDILFPALANLNVLSGGPHCGYYFQLYLERPSPLTQAFQLAPELFTGDPSATLPFHCPTTAGSPLNPILEEHILGRAISRRLRSLLEDPALDAAGLNNHFFRLFQLYEDMIREHIAKENQCLFAMVDQYFPDTTQEVITRKFQALDESLWKESSSIYANRLLNTLKSGIPDDL